MYWGTLQSEKYFYSHFSRLMCRYRSEHKSILYLVHYSTQFIENSLLVSRILYLCNISNQSGPASLASIKGRCYPASGLRLLKEEPIREASGKARQPSLQRTTWTKYNSRRNMVLRFPKQLGSWYIQVEGPLYACILFRHSRIPVGRKGFGKALVASRQDGDLGDLCSWKSNTCSQQNLCLYDVPILA